MKKPIKLPPEPTGKDYFIKEIRATIFCMDDEDFERRKAKLLHRSERYVTGGLAQPTKVNDFIYGE